jgi:hypothetical protein
MTFAHLANTNRQQHGVGDSSRKDGIPRQPWIDWLKVAGMQLILFGHTGGESMLPRFFSPINAKQLGVAFFIFATAFTLTHEKRRGVRVVFERFFEVAYLGIFLCMVLSLIHWYTRGDLLESNYLPYIFGLNVYWENAFPANPSTWYVGMYFHLLCLWAVLLRWIPLNWVTLLIALGTEIFVRAGWLGLQRDYNAYMSVTNWISVFLMGRLAGEHASILDTAAPTSTAASQWGPPKASWPIAVLAATMLLGNHAIVQSLGITHSNPFGRIPTKSQLISALVTSTHITFLYLAFTAIVVCLLARAPENRSIRFLASNTLWVFLCHMPVRDWLTPYYYSLIPGWPRQIFNFFLFFVALAYTSKLVRWLLQVGRMKEWVAGRGRWLKQQADWWR